MGTAVAIIGANFGDEGKGLMTDYFAKKYPDAIVIRFNGGAQAGHTVQLKNGTRHVFHHFGSGMLRGNDTYLSRFFIVNPLLFDKEYNILNKLPNTSKAHIFIDDSCLVTTPYDMLINQEININSPHATCGVGINETVERHLEGFILTWKEISTWSRKQVYSYLDMLRINYVHDRLKRLKITPSESFKERLHEKSIIELFYHAIQVMYRTTLSSSLLGIAHNYVYRIYEGAQGLLLDQDNQSYYPFLTRSNTGIRNVEKLEQRMMSDELEVVYTSRAYVTRHGKGPLPNEDKNLSYSDQTNAYNEFQGGLRYAPLNPRFLESQILQDRMASCNSGFEHVNKYNNTAITCLDQVDKKTRLSILSDRPGAHPIKYVSYGPTAEDVRELDS